MLLVSRIRRLRGGTIALAAAASPLMVLSASSERCYIGSCIPQKHRTRLRSVNSCAGAGGAEVLI